jgi:hypothetical protein
MRRRVFTLCVIGVLAVEPLACTTSGASDCESARQQVVTVEQTICGEAGYKDSKFCARCVTAGYFSTTGASVCQCSNLTFDSQSCSYATGDDATAQVRNAIDWADSVCPDFTPPAAIPPTADGSAADGAMVEAAVGDTATDDVVSE